MATLKDTRSYLKTELKSILRDYCFKKKTPELIKELEMEVRNQYQRLCKTCRVSPMPDLEEVSLIREGWPDDAGRAYVLLFKDGSKEIIGPELGPQKGEPGHETW